MPTTRKKRPRQIHTAETFRPRVYTTRRRDRGVKHDGSAPAACAPARHPPPLPLPHLVSPSPPPSPCSHEASLPVQTLATFGQLSLLAQYENASLDVISPITGRHQPNYENASLDVISRNPRPCEAMQRDQTFACLHVITPITGARLVDRQPARHHPRQRTPHQPCPQSAP